MSDETRRWLRLAILTFAAGLGGFCLTLQQAAVSGGELTTWVWVSAGAQAGLAMSTTIGAGLSQAPGSH